MPLIIWGRRNVFSTKGTGQFICPRCNQTRPYRLQNARRFFTLYFIPLFSMEDLGDFVECMACHTQYKTDVLAISNNIINAKRLASELNITVKRVLAMMVLVDGDANEKEIEVMQTLYNKMTKIDLSPEAVKEEIGFAKVDTRDVRHVLGNLANTLQPAGKDLLIEAAYLVAAADGELKAEEQDLLNYIGSSLRLTASQVQDIVQKVQQK